MRGCEKTSEIATQRTTATTMRWSVEINVYDLNDLNEYSYWLGFGVFHSGVVVHDKEWSFGGHEFASSGCFFCEPGKVPAPAKFRTRVHVGWTKKTSEEVERIVSRLGGEEFRGNKYHLLLKNCNHFVETLVENIVEDSDGKNSEEQEEDNELMRGGAQRSNGVEGTSDENNSSSNNNNNNCSNRNQQRGGMFSFLMNTEIFGGREKCPSWINRLSRVAMAANRFVPCVLPLAIRQAANVPVPGQFNEVTPYEEDDGDYNIFDANPRV